MTSAGSPLTCLEMVTRLDDYVDRYLDADEIRRVEEHLAGCLDCAREFRFEAALLEGIRQRLNRIAVPPDLLDTIRARLAAEHGTIPGQGAL
jgi:anti-sigma factor (TIGR02949 family)